jgi:hypothetical protein
MRTLTTQKLWLAAACVLCVALTWRYTTGLEGTEFSGGRITGPMLDMFDTGTLLFVLALATTFLFPRIGSVIALLASLLCFPLYVYFTAPGPFRRIVSGEYSVQLQSKFVFAPWAIAGMFALAITLGISLRTFAVFGQKGGARSER